MQIFKLGNRNTFKMFCLATTIAVYSCFEPVIMWSYEVECMRCIPTLRLPRCNLYLCIINMELRQVILQKLASKGSIRNLISLIHILSNCCIIFFSGITSYRIHIHLCSMVSFSKGGLGMDTSRHFR